jgi:hypothetical protein
MPRPRLSPIPSRASTRRLFLISLLGGAVACSSSSLHPGDGGSPGTGGAAGQATDAGSDSPVGTGGNPDAGGTTGGPGGVGGFMPLPPAAPLTSTWQIVNPDPLHKVDILFMVDNSFAMIPLQSAMLASFPAFANVLKALPGGLPDLHLGVVSSDTGPGKFDLPQYHCAFHGDDGKFQSQPRGICTASPFMAANQTFLQASNDQQTKNYTGDIADAFTCIAALGDQGCGFEGQLKSVHWALDSSLIPVRNPGFLRPDAFLAVVLLTNEDDCSVPDDSDLVDPTQTKMSDPLGPLWSFRCNEFGHLCGAGTVKVPPPREASLNLQGCVSNDGPTGKLTRLADEVAFLKGLKSNQADIVVAAISAPPTPYSVEMIQQATDTEQHPNIVHSCTLNSSVYGDPSVRITQWASAFGASGSTETMCANSLGPAMQRIGNRVANLFRPACAPGPFATNGQPACRVIDQVAAGNAVAETLLPNCSDNGNTAPCWTSVADATNCGTGQRVTVNRGASLPAGYVDTAFTCDPCGVGSTEIGCH